MDELKDVFAEWELDEKALLDAKHKENMSRDRVKEAVISTGRLHLLTVNIKAVKREIHFERNNYMSTRPKYWDNELVPK